MDNNRRIEWQNTADSRTAGREYMPSISYICGHCDNPLASDRGYYAYEYDSAGNSTGRTVGIRICHHCRKPTYFEDDKQTPGSAFGNPVSRLPSDEVAALYKEARNCMKVNAYTAAVMCCRKLLMNVAVSEGADEGKSFAAYVTYLADEGHIPPKATAWVDHIRARGNDANHEIRVMDRQDAEQLIRFSEMMLWIMYEYPAEVKEQS